MSGKLVPPIPTPSQNAMPSSPDPLFNPETHTQGGLPHLVEFLVAEYRQLLRQANETRQAQGQALLDPEAVLKSAKPLLDFFKAYLKTNRPVQVFALDANYGVILSNNARVAIAPGTPLIQGTMQDSGAVQVSQGMTQPGQDGVVPVNNYRVQ